LSEEAGERRLWLLAGAAVVALTAWSAYGLTSATGDYGNPGCSDWHCEDPSTSLHALVTGDLGTFFREQPGVGLTSLALRAPAVAIAHAAGGGLRAEYRAGALMCVVTAGLLAVWISWRARQRGASLPAALGLLVLWVVAIVWGRSLTFGHPEEPLAGALAIVAVLLAAERRPVAAAIAIGLAIGTKEWAFLAAPAVVLAGQPRDWRRMALPAVATLGLTIGVLAIGNPSSFRAAHEALQHGDEHPLTPANVWFRFGHKQITAVSGSVVAYVVHPPKAIGRWCRPFVTLLALVTGLIFYRRRGFGSLDTLALVAFLFVCRGVFDTQTFSYHLSPMLMAIPAWEVLSRQRLPVVGALAAVAFELTVHVVAPHMSANAFNAIYLAWTLPLLSYLLVMAMRRPATPCSARSARRRRRLARSAGT
jgi:hypothetical protein